MPHYCLMAWHDIAHVHNPPTSRDKLHHSRTCRVKASPQYLIHDHRSFTLPINVILTGDTQDQSAPTPSARAGNVNIGVCCHAARPKRTLPFPRWSVRIHPWLFRDLSEVDVVVLPQPTTELNLKILRYRREINESTATSNVFLLFFSLSEGFQ